MSFAERVIWREDDIWFPTYVYATKGTTLVMISEQDVDETNPRAMIFDSVGKRKVSEGLLSDLLMRLGKVKTFPDPISLSDYQQLVSTTT